MAFSIEPNQMKEVLVTGIPNPDEDLAPYGETGSFNDLAKANAAGDTLQIRRKLCGAGVL